MTAAAAHTNADQSVRSTAGTAASGSALTGLLFLVLSVVSLMTDPVPSLDLLFAAAWLCALIPVWQLHTAYAGRGGVMSKIGAVMLTLGAAANAVGLVVRVAGSDALFWLVLPVGGLLIFLGLAAFALATWRAHVLPRWCGLAMAAALPLTFLTSIWFPIKGDGAGDYPGVFVVAALWLALAVTIRRRLT